MRHQDQVAVGQTLLRYLDEKCTAMAEHVYANEVSDYTCPKQAAAEKQLFFRSGPANVGLSCLLPNANDFMTVDETGLPILLVRREDGSLGAFLNVCRHRGARVAEGCGNAKLFTCPYHAWSYDTFGKLRGRPDDRSFAEFDKATVGLTPLPVVEKYGMIYVASAPGAAFELDSVLAGVEHDLAGYKLDGYHHYETRVLRRPLNWKVVIDTFLETYHLQYLHTNTVSPILHSNTATFDAFGANLRMVSARRNIDKLRDIPPEQWNVVPFVAAIYVLFPNTVFIMQGDHVETWHVYPSGDGINESTMRVSFYIPEPVTSEKAKGHWDRNFNLLMATVEDEDFPLAEGIQRGFHTKAQDAIRFGRNEPALQHFHRSVKQALATSASGG
jgi:phenylpropionate dioxygenase-like ring-hydroxylating dioxygenase large terminal subunit